MNAPRESGSTRCYFHVDRVTGGRSSPVERSEISVARSIVLIPGFLCVRNADEPTNANELALVSYEIGGSRHKNFNLDIFRINEFWRTRIRLKFTYSFRESSLSYTYIIIPFTIFLRTNVNNMTS